MWETDDALLGAWAFNLIFPWITALAFSVAVCVRGGSAWVLVSVPLSIVAPFVLVGGLGIDNGYYKAPLVWWMVLSCLAGPAVTGFSILTTRTLRRWWWWRLNKTREREATSLAAENVIRMELAPTEWHYTTIARRRGTDRVVAVCGQVQPVRGCLSVGSEPPRPQDFICQECAIANSN